MRVIVFCWVVMLAARAFGEIKTEPLVYEIDGKPFQGFLLTFLHIFHHSKNLN